jgi:hypothetical protein
MVRATFPDEKMSLAAKFEVWRNIFASTSGHGYYAGLEGVSRMGAFEWTLEAARAEMACASLPPIATRSVFFPGTRNTLVEGQVAFAPAPSLQLFTRAFYNVPTVHRTRGLCANLEREQLDSNIPVFEMLFGFVYKVPEDAAKLD